jgi:hypothetical protein
MTTIIIDTLAFIGAVVVLSFVALVLVGAYAGRP